MRRNHRMVGIGVGRRPWGFIVLCTVPTLLLTIYCTIYPTGRALAMSFTDATSMNLTDNAWIGWDNYRYLFRDASFLETLRNTLKLMAVVPVVTLSFSLLLGATIHQSKLREREFYQTVFFFPSIISMTVIAILWSFIFHPNMGLLNTILDALHLSSLKHAWLGDRGTALWCIAATLVWQATGYYMIMYIAAMSGISPEIYEAATIDGAGGARKLFSITLPLLKDIIGITYVLSLSGTINLSYVLVMVMTGGGPNGASSVLLQYMYEQGFRNGSFGYAMAITVFTLAISIVLSWLSRKLTARTA